MKIRTDFVTNSSSSSYIIAYKTIPELDKETTEKYPFIQGMYKLCQSILTGENVNSVEDLIAYFLNHYGWGEYNTLAKIFEDDEYLENRYKRLKERIEQGYSITFKELDNYEETLSDILWSLNDGVNFIVESDN